MRWLHFPSVLAAMDETTPEGPSGIYYVVAAAILVADADTASKVAAGSIPSDRSRPFHWHLEGETARRRMIDGMSEVGAVAHIAVHHPTGRKGQERARAEGLRAIIPKLLEEGVSELRIESRQDQDDVRDKTTILTTLEMLGKPGAFAYGWHPKAEPTLWFADAICGATRAWLLGTGEPHYDELVAAGVVTEPIWLAPSSDMRKSRLPS